MTMISHGMTMGGPFTKGKAGHSSKSCGNNTTWSDKGCCSLQHYTTWTDLKRYAPRQNGIYMPQSMAKIYNGRKSY